MTVYDTLILFSYATALGSLSGFIVGAVLYWTKILP